MHLHMCMVPDCYFSRNLLYEYTFAWAYFYTFSILIFPLKHSIQFSREQKMHVRKRSRNEKEFFCYQNFLNQFAATEIMETISCELS